MKNLLSDLIAFHRACDLPVLDTPQIPPPDRVALRIELIREEVNRELLPAMEANDLTEMADAMADSIYVIVGAALEYGIPLDKVWQEVQRANMAKVDPATGKVRKREDGKVLKPEGWTPPDIAGVLAEASKPKTTGETFFCGSRTGNAMAIHYPDGDTWRILPNGDRSCSFCGSMHPEDFLKCVEEAADPATDTRLGRSDKNYKFYVHRKAVSNGSNGGIKFYIWHLPDQEFANRLNAVYGKAILESQRKLSAS